MASQGSRYDGAAADVYACGILLYKWLRNHHPFIRNKGDRKESDTVIEDRIMKGEADFKLERTPGSPGELIWKMIRADPKRRWTVGLASSCKSFLSSLNTRGLGRFLPSWRIPS